MRQFILVISYIFFLIILLELRERTTFELESYVKRVRALLFMYSVPQLLQGESARG